MKRNITLLVVSGLLTISFFSFLIFGINVASKSQSKTVIPENGEKTKDTSPILMSKINGQVKLDTSDIKMRELSIYINEKEKHPDDSGYFVYDSLSKSKYVLSLTVDGYVTSPETDTVDISKELNSKHVNFNLTISEEKSSG